MKLSTKGRYAARAMLELAINYNKGSILLREIAQKQGISARYLERMMAALVSSGLIRSPNHVQAQTDRTTDPAHTATHTAGATSNQNWIRRQQHHTRHQCQ